MANDEPESGSSPQTTDMGTSSTPMRRWLVCGVILMVLVLILMGWCAYLTTEQYVYHKKSHNVILDLQHLVYDVRSLN